MIVPKELQQVVHDLEQGIEPRIPVRTLLSWFGAYRRSWRNVSLIKEVFEGIGVTTDPDFEEPFIDDTVALRKKESLSHSKTEGTESAHRISRLEAAGRPPVSVKPDATVKEAVTLMLARDFSQLPVMQSDRSLRGLISWRSIGSRLAMGVPCTFVRECVDEAIVIPSSASLFDAVRIIADHDCVFVKTADNTIKGPVTAYDISAQYQQLAKPFLLLGEIESRLRTLLFGKFSREELEAAKNPQDTERSVSGVADLTFGEYLRLLQNEANWEKLGLELDRGAFVKDLDRVREVRNDIMHFDPDPVKAEDLNALENFAGFLWKVEQIQKGPGQ